MYTIKVDGIGLYAPNLANEGYSVLNPKITYELNKAGSLEFVVPSNNVNYNKIHKLKSIVQVFDDGVEIFRGRVLHDDTDFYKRKSVYCEGELAFLLDSIVRSYDYQGNFDGLFNQMIENHNSQVDDEKKFKIGQITVKDKNNYIHYSSTQYPNTWDEINEKLIKTHGGYLRVRLDDGERYIDYIEDYTNVSDQVIEFGKNMIDLSTYISADDVFTVLIPLGSQIKNESGETTGRVTIESVNDGKDYIQDDNAISIFGKIVKTQKWDNVSQPENLLYKANEYLESGVQMATTLTMKAVDLHLLDVNVESIKLGDYCRVVSIPHGIDRLFQCSKVQVDLTNPQNSVYTFGLNLKSMTDQQLSNNSDVKSIISNTNDSSKQELEQKITNAQQAMKNEMADAVNKISGGTNGHVVLVKNDDGETNELYAFDGESLFSSLKLLRLNYEGIAGTDKGYNGEYKLAISTDGKINAEQLVVGIIRDALGKNFWNLETGEFSLTGYATDQELSDGLSSANTTAKGYADGALSNANTYTDRQAQGALDTAKSYADGKVSALNTALTQKEIFNRLTNNGQTQGIYLQNGKIYINLEYLVSKVIKGLSIFGSTITFGDDGATYRVQASYRESDTSYDGYKPKGVLFQTYHADASIQHVTDRFFVTYFSDKVHNPLQITRSQSILRAENSSGSVDAFFVATAKDDGPVANVTAIASDVMNTVSVTKKGIKLAVSYTGKYLFLDNATGDFSFHSMAANKNDYIFSSSGGNVTYKTYLNNFLQACDGSGNVKAYLQMYSNGQAWLSSDGQMVLISKGHSWLKSLGNDVYIQSRDSSDNSTNSYVYVQKDGKVQIGSSGNKNTIINGYPAVRINGSYHDIFFQWNGASLIATVDVTQVWSTSDRRLKDQIDDISDDYIDAIGSAEIKQFIFTDEIYDKSIKHFGVIAQDVREALEAKGINPEEIAVNNHFDRDGEEYYGIDKDEFFMARIAYDEKIIKELKNEISDLREQMNILTDLIKQKGE